MSLDISTLAIAVTSTGITEAAKALNDLVTSANKAEKAFPGLKTAAEALNASNKSSVDAVTALLTKLQKQADLLGANQASINAYNAALKGANQAQIEVARSLGAQVDQHNAAAKAIKDHEAAVKKASGSQHDFNLITAGSTRELIVLGHELSQGNFQRMFGSLIVMGERINFLPKALAAASEFASSLGISIGMLAVGFAALAAIVASAIYTWYKSNEAIHEFNKELILTGHYAGVSGQQMYDMSNKVGEATGRFGAATSAFTQLTATGKFTAEQINTIATAATNLAANGGPAIDVVIKQFERLAAEPLKGAEKGFNGISKAVIELDTSLHFMEPALLSQIMHLENIGDVAGASKLAINALAAEENKRAAELQANLSELGRIAQANIWFFGNMWHALFSPSSDQEKLIQAKEQLKAIQELTGVHPDWTVQADFIKKIGDLQKKINDEVVANAKKSATDRINLDANLALVYADNMFKRKRGDESLRDALIRDGEMIQAFRKSGQQSELFTDEANLKRQLDLVKDFAEKKKAIPGIGLSGLDEEIKALDLQFTKQENVYDAELRLLEKQRKNKQVSDLVYFADKEDLLKEELKNVEDMYGKEILAATNFHSTNVKLMNEAATKKAELEKKLDTAQTRINEKIDANHSDEIKAANASQVAAEKAYTTTVNNLEKEIRTLEDKNNAYKALPESIRQVGITQKQLADQITQSTIDRLEADKLEDTLGDKEIARLNNQIRLLKEKRTLQQTNESDTAFNDLMLKQTAAAEDAWKAAAKHIEDSLYNAFANGLGTGIKKLITDIKSWFARLVLQPIISPIAQAGASLINPTAASAVNGASMLGASAGISSGIGGLVGGLGSLTGSTALSEFGVGMANPTSALVISGMSDAASAGAAFASALSTAIPWIAAAGVAFKVWNTFFEDGPEQNTHLKFTSNNTPGNISINERGNEGKNSQSYIDANGTSAFGTFGVSSSLWMSSSQKVVQDFITNVSKTDDVLAQFLTGAEKASVIANITGKTSTAYTGPEGSDPTAVKGPNGTTINSLDQVFSDRIHNIMEGVETGLSSLTDGFKGTSQELANETSAILQYRMALKDGGEAMFGMKVTLQEVAALRLPTENVSAALNRVTGVFNATNGVLNILGKTSEEAFGQIGLASFDLRNNLVVAAGGVDKLVSSTSYFTQNILTDAEKLKPVTDALKSSLVNLGLSADTTFQQYHDLVLAQKLSTVEGQKMYLALLDLAPAFKAIQDAAGTAATAVDNSAEIIKKQRELDIALLTALGKTEEATAATRYDELTALRELSPQLAVTQQAIYDAIDAQAALTAANKAAEDAATAAAAALQAMKDSITANVEALKKVASNDFDILNKSIQQAKANSKAEFDTQDTIIKAQKSSAQELMNSSKATIEINKQGASDAYDTFKTATSATLDTAKLANTAIADLSSSLSGVLDTIKEAAGYSMTRAAGQQIIADALGIAKSTGVLPSADSLKDAIKAVGTNDTSTFRTFQDFTKDARITANNLIGLSDITDKAKTVSDLQLDTLNKSLDFAKASYDAQVLNFKAQEDLAQKTYDDTITKLDESLATAQAKLDSDNVYYDSMLSTAKDQLDVMNGTYIATIAVTTALNNFNQSVLTATTASKAASAILPAITTSSGQASTDQITQLYQSILGRAPDAEGLAFWKLQASNGASISTIAQDFLNSTEYMSMHPSHANGLDFVPRDNYVANLHVGERVQTAKAARDADQTAEEIRQLRAEIQAQNLSLIQITREHMKIVRKWDGEGLPDTRTVAI